MDIDGGKLRELREGASLSLRELEKLSGVHYTTIGMIERGKRQAHAGTIRKLAAALGVEVQALRGDDRERDAWIRGYALALVDRGAMWDAARARAVERWDRERLRDMEGGG